MICSTGLETGCKPVLLQLHPGFSEKILKVSKFCITSVEAKNLIYAEAEK